MNRQMHNWWKLVLATAMSVAMIVGLAGCRKSNGKEQTAIPASRPAAAAQTQPVEDDEGAMEVLVKKPLTRPAQKDAYRQDDKMPDGYGKLVGAVRFKGQVVAKGAVPPAPIMDLASGPWAIKNPEKGELEYFANLKLKEPRWLHHDFVIPTWTVLVFKDLKRGRLDMISRPTYLIRQGNFDPYISFVPLGERVMVGTYDSYETPITITRLSDGTVVSKGVVSQFDPDTIKPLGGGGVHFTARPKMLQSQPLTELGCYKIQSDKRPWQSAYAWAVDNPYCVYVHGQFTVDNIPVGKQRIEVWHSDFKPVRQFYEVQIVKDETRELGIELEPADYLKPVPASQPAGK